LLVSTVSLFFLQGFKPGGFNLDGALLKWLGLATVGEIGGLLTLTFGAIFKGQKKSD
jgi:multisubunit Na+/H+ antiporter MnhB subunit